MNVADEYFICPRGSAKSGTAYIAGVRKLYDEGKIDKEGYLYMTGAALILLFGHDEESVYKWIDEELKKYEEGNKI